MRGLQIAQVNAAAVAGGHHLLQVESVRFHAELVAIGAAAQSHIQVALGAAQFRGGGDHCRGVGAEETLGIVGKLQVVQLVGVLVRALALHDGSKFDQCLPLFRLSFGSGKHGFAVACVVAPRELGEGHVVVQVFEW
jgi:hypothetical protein